MAHVQGTCRLLWTVFLVPQSGLLGLRASLESMSVGGGARGTPPASSINVSPLSPAPPTGGLQAIAELLQVDYEMHKMTRDPLNLALRRYAGMTLTNLTFGDVANKVPTVGPALELT